MTSKTTVDAARVELLLNELRLPGIKLMWAKLAEQSDKEGWPAARFLSALAEHEMVDRGRRRMERHLAEARLPAGKTLATFDFESVPMVSKAQVMALASGDAWLAKGANILLFGPPGGGKSHLSSPGALTLMQPQAPSGLVALGWKLALLPSLSMMVSSRRGSTCAMRAAIGSGRYDQLLPSYLDPHPWLLTARERAQAPADCPGSR